MPLLIHPGFHKTGTTWLQQQLFTDRRHFHMMFDHADIDRLFVSPHDLDFSADAAKAEVDTRRSGPDSGLIDVISSETLCGQMFHGSRLSKVTAQRLADSCGPARILFTVRGQLSATQSIYMQYLKRGGRLSIDDYLSYQPEPGYDWFNPSVVSYAKLAHCYGDLFGHENILVLPQELLAKDRTAWLSHLFRFLHGADFAGDISLDDRPREGVSPPASGIPLLRAANIFRAGTMNPNAIRSLGWLGTALNSIAYRWKLGDVSARKRMRATIARHFSGKFGASNRALQPYCPVDLAQLGYEME